MTLITTTAQRTTVAGTQRAAGAMLWVVAALFLALALAFTPARIEPYLPAQAARLNQLLITGIQLTRVVLVLGALLAMVTSAIWKRWPPGAEREIGICWEKREFVIAALLVLGALCLRLPNIAESFWWDELGSHARVVQRGLAVIFAFSADGNNHIGNSVLMWIASRFGNDEWILRMPNLIIGTLMPAAVYLLFQRVGSKSVGLVAAVLIAVHFRMVDFSNEARGYIGSAAFGAMSSLALAGLINAWNTRWAIFYFLTAALTGTFMVTGVYVIAAHMALAGIVFLYRVRFDASGDWRPPLWAGVAGGWALVVSLLVSALTLPQVADYSHNRALSFHRPVDWIFYSSGLPYWTGVEHHSVAVVLLAAVVIGYWRARRNALLWAAVIGPILVQAAYFHATESPASPRVFISIVFPLVVGFSLFIHSQWQKGGFAARTTALLIAAIFVADSVPVFARYYLIGSPDLRQLAERLPSNDVFIAHDQAGTNAYYFPGAPWEERANRVTERLSAMNPRPRFVVSGGDCRQPNGQNIEQLGYTATEKLNDWTYAEYANNQRRPCYVVYERNAP